MMKKFWEKMVVMAVQYPQSQGPRPRPLSLLRQPGQLAWPNPAGPQAAQSGEREKKKDCVPCRGPLPLCCRDRDGGEVHCWAKANGAALVRALESYKTQLPACSPDTPAHWLARGWVSKRALWRKPGSTSYLTFHLRTTIPPAIGWKPH